MEDSNEDKIIGRKKKRIYTNSITLNAAIDSQMLLLMFEEAPGIFVAEHSRLGCLYVESSVANCNCVWSARTNWGVRRGPHDNRGL
jgi:hypothetical protein